MRIWRVCRAFLLAFAVVVLLPFASYAQSPSATVTGEVTDQQGRAVPGATIIFTNLNTNIQSKTQTNGEGIYRVVSLQPGIYRANVSKDGFKSIVKGDIELHVQDQLSINFSVQIGSVSESITVEGGAPLINTESAAVSTIVDRQFAENLPMNGRSFQTLIQLTPGTVVTASNGQDVGQFSINGQRAASNYWTVDGVGANIGIGASSINTPGNALGGTVGSFSALGGTNSLVSVDAMQEFRIQTSTYAPEFGRTPGGQISIVTRSGTNQFHGTAFDFLRNDVLDANDWFANSAGLGKPQERQNDFGGTLSGPIVKDRTFFFFSYEGLRLRLPQTALTRVPDLTARQNAIPAMQPFLNAYPQQSPNLPDNLTTGVAGFNASYSNPASLDAYSLRIDHKLSDKINLFGRYNYSPSSLTQRGAFNTSLSSLFSTDITTQTGTVGATWAISSATVNDLRFNYSRTNATSLRSQDSFGGAVPLASLPFPSPFTSQDSSFRLVIFNLGLGNGLWVGHSAENLQRQINIVDSLSVQKGSHSLKFGIDFRRLSPEFGPIAYQQFPGFRNVLSAENGNLFFAATSSNLGATFLFRNVGVYGQDTWRIGSRLTLTYGLRWDVDFVPQSTKGPDFAAVTGFNLNDLSTLAIAPAGTRSYKTTYGNFAPRIGVAYQLSQSQEWQTVLRGGFGVFYDLATSEAGNLISFGIYPFGNSALIFGGTFPLSAAAAAPPAILPPDATQGNLFAVDPHLKLPYTLEWNVALEQALGKQQSISASYIGASGRRLLQSLSAQTPSFRAAGLVTNAGTSDYNALQVRFQRRLSHGLQAHASYSWSHSIDTASAGSTAIFSNSLVPGANASNRGPSDFDIRHAFTAGITYDVPAPKINAFSNAILRGWSVQSIVVASSAPPVDISDTNFFAFASGIFAEVRPDIVQGQPFYLQGAQCASVLQAAGSLAPGASCPGGRGFNPAAFTDPPTTPAGCVPGIDFPCDPARQGNLGRNALRGFGTFQWDLAIHRDFPIHESLKLQFRAEMFNVLNHPNFGPQGGGWPFPPFGVSTKTLGQYLNGGTANGGISNVGGGAFNPLYQVGGSRSIQLALKLLF